MQQRSEAQNGASLALGEKRPPPLSSTSTTIDGGAVQGAGDWQELLPHGGGQPAGQPRGGSNTPILGPNRRRILLVDSEPVMRFGLIRLINQEPDLLVCGEASTVSDALTAVERLRPDLLLLEILLPDANGLDLTWEMQSRFPEVPVLVFSTADEEIFAERALRAGARGYLMKREGVPDLLNALRQVLQGDVHVSQRMSTRILAGYANSHPKAHHSELAALSDREFQVFLGLAEGLASEEIGHRLHISSKTVDTHRWHIRVKLQLPTLPDLTRYALRWGASTEARPGPPADKEGAGR